jgi:hypothetical protein
MILPVTREGMLFKPSLASFLDHALFDCMNKTTVWADFVHCGLASR